MQNTTYGLDGRLGNHIFYNLVMSILAEKSNIKVTYSVYNSQIKAIGIPIFEHGTLTFSTSMRVTTENALPLLIGAPIAKNIIIPRDNYFQTHDIAIYLRDYLWSSTVSERIKQHNLHKERYNNNNDVFVHVRLGDLTGNFSQPLSYYDNALCDISFNKGYISSDSPNHPIIRELCAKYSLTLLNVDEVETIMFGSTCKHVVLSHGTFSWIIGILSYMSDVYVPNYKARWHGDIFEMPGWHKVPSM